MECYIGQVIEPTFGDKLTQLFVYCNILQGEMRRRLVVQRHLCFETEMGDNSTTNRVLEIY
jgi:hypothetical protein